MEGNEPNQHDNRLVRREYTVHDIGFVTDYALCIVVKPLQSKGGKP